METSVATISTRARSRAPSAFVVRDPPPEEVDARIDWSLWYLTDEQDMGQSVEQGDEIQGVLSSLGVLVEERGWRDVLVAADNFFAWIEFEPLVRVSPDVYLLDDAPPKPRPKMWQTWLPGHNPPRWALEIVSDDWKKDYDDNPSKYAQLGTRELVIFDPHAEPGGSEGDGRGAPTRVPLQVYRMDADGAFVRVYRGDGPARSEEIDAWLVVQREGAAVRIRLARDAAGRDVVPTALEAKRAAEEATRAAEEATRLAEEATRLAEEATRAAEAKAIEETEARLQAEARLRALEDEVRKLRG